MHRREFMKKAAAALGVMALPAVPIALPSLKPSRPLPRWVIEPDYESLFRQAERIGAELAYQKEKRILEIIMGLTDEPGQQSPGRFDGYTTTRCPSPR